MKIGPISILFNNKADVEKKQVKKDTRPKPKAKDKNFLLKSIGLIRSFSFEREGFEYPEFNLEEIKLASVADSYIKTSLGKYSNLVFKAGYNLKGDNQEAIDYVETRWKIMKLSTKQSMNLLFEGVAKDVVTYGNCFLIKVRTDEKNLGGIKAQGYKSARPVGGYFRIPPETVSIKRDVHGNVEKYRQAIHGEEKEYSPNDIIHIYIDKDANSAFGTPRIQAALEDVKMLRRIEGNILSLIYRFSIPIYQWKIGIPAVGFQASDREIDEARSEIERATLDGMFITNEKTEIKSIGAEGSALNATGYLNYFESRVFSALEVSTAQMGRDSTKSNADSVETQIHDTVKYIQRMIKEKIENEIINEILIEGGFNPITKKEDEVKFLFNEISLDTKVKIENHELMKYQSNLITLEEARQAIGKEPKLSEKDLYQSRIVDNSAKAQSNVNATNSIKIAKAQHEMQMEMQKENAKTQEKIAKQNAKAQIQAQAQNGDMVQSDVKEKPDGKGALGNGKAKTGGKNNAAKNMAMPQNQHGTSSVKIKESLENMAILGKKKDEHEKNFENIYKKYSKLCNTIVKDKNSISYKKDILNKGFEEIKEDIEKDIETFSIDGIRQSKKDYEKLINNNVNVDKVIIIDYDKLMGSMYEDLDKIKEDISSGIDNPTESFEKCKYRLRFLIEYYLPKSFYYSYLSAGKHFGVKKAKVIFNKDSKDVDEYNETIDLDKIDINGIPAFHAYCKCKIKFID